MVFPPEVLFILFVCFAAEGEMVDGEVKSDSSPEREPTAEDDSKDTDACKKRKRKPYRPGKRQDAPAIVA